MKMKSENETKKQNRAEIFFFFLEKFETVTSSTHIKYVTKKSENLQKPKSYLRT
jgi:hypothetical protein